MHDPQTKAAVMAALLSGQSLNEIATSYHIDKSVVSRWKKQLTTNGLQNNATQKTQELVGLLLDYVSTNLQTLKAQSIEAGRPEYVKKQPASELAVLHGVLADKTVRILAALEPIESPSESSEPELIN